jgi:catechol 2,3-dioxygenase-like lactoylglutathione lyase family enzyme
MESGGQSEASDSPTITLVSGDPLEEQAGWQLLRLLERYDLRKWQFTDAVQIDQTAIPHSMPVLTLNARYLRDDERALATYLHEQLHWFVFGRQVALHRAIRELRQRYPSVPPFEAGGARDETSTYVHLVVCPLEYAALTEVIGAEAARAAIERADVYTWIYATILQDWSYFADLLSRHALVVGDPPAAPVHDPTYLGSAPQPAAGRATGGPTDVSACSLQLYVLDLYASADFYIRALGFSVQYTRPPGLQVERSGAGEGQRPGLEYIFLRNGPMYLGLNPASALPNDHSLRRNQAAPRGLGCEMLLVVSDAGAAEQRVREAGFPIASPAQLRPWGATDFCLIDPDGHLIRVVSRQ